MKTRVTAAKTGSNTGTESRVDTQLMKVGFGVITVSSCVIGLWAAASLVGGIAASDGVLGLLANWFKAVAG